MRKGVYTFVLFVTWAISALAQVQYVNPIIGTDGMGHTFPGACVPFGIVQLSPDTDTFLIIWKEFIRKKFTSIVQDTAIMILPL